MHHGMHAESCRAGVLGQLCSHSDEPFALEGLRLAGVIAEEVAALATITRQEVQLAPAAQEGRGIHIQIVVILRQHVSCASTSVAVQSTCLEGPALVTWEVCMYV